jgi:uncharacterized membrane-anchored protein
VFETPVDQDAGPAWLRRIVDSLKARERLLLAIGAIAQLVVLAGMIAVRGIPYFTGETVLLQVVPIDPRDMFRGDYVILGYEFSRLPPGGIEKLAPVGSREASAKIKDQIVYVSLVPQPDGIHYRSGGFSLTPPPSGKFLRGKIVGWNRIEFGIENFFVQEGTGHKYEDAIRSRHLWAEVAVTTDGRAVVKGLRIE